MTRFLAHFRHSPWLLLVACGGTTPAPTAEPTASSATQPELPPTASEPPPQSSIAAPTSSVASTPIATASASASPAPSAPPPEAKVPPGSDALPVDGANLSIGSVTADGFTVTDVSCKSPDAGGLAGLVLGPALAASMGKKKAQLRACAPKGGTARVRFDMTGGRVVNAEAKGATPEIEACLVRTLKTMPAPLGGTCAATVDLSR